MNAYQDVRGPDGRLLFRFDPERMVVEIVVKGVTYTVDLTAYMAHVAAIIDTDPLVGVNGLTPNGHMM